MENLLKLKGDGVPINLPVQPTLSLALIQYITAYNKLRVSKTDLGNIYLSEILNYINVYPQSNKELFIELIQFLDSKTTNAQILKHNERMQR